MSHVRKRPIKMVGLHLHPPQGNIQPVLLNDNPVKDLTDHTEVQVDGVKITIAMSDLKMINKLGEGHYGMVDEMRHPPSNLVFAVKQIRCSMNDKQQKRILNDLNISMRSTQCPYVVISYGAMYRSGDVWICMELMDSSLDKFYKLVSDRKSFIPENLLGYMTFCVVSALEYLHVVLHVIHRDVKPSNVLINKFGWVKVCDFGISGNLVNSIAETNVGTESYLAPERINTEQNMVGYTIRSDVWSLGLSVLELAILKYPFSHRSSIYDQIVNVVERPPPSLPENSPYSDTVRNFISRCLVKEVHNRASYVELLQHDMIRSFNTQSALEQVQLIFADYVIQILDITVQ